MSQPNNQYPASSPPAYGYPQQGNPQSYPQQPQYAQQPYAAAPQQPYAQQPYAQQPAYTQPNTGYIPQTIGAGSGMGGATHMVETGQKIEELGGSCLDCLSGPPGVPDNHPLGGCSAEEFVQGWCICCGYGHVQHFNGESVDASPCNLGLAYFLPYIGGIVGFVVHYPLRQRLESKLVSGSTIGAAATCPCVDACCVFCFPACHMCQELRAVRGAMYRSQQGAAGAYQSEASPIVKS
eukprot:m.162209 g.162209  ORF g.162209 m.162209 type:complete len:237 (-) comp12160_c0_seq1:207-917(-)